MTENRDVVHSTYRMRISNEFKERQYMDVAELKIVKHAPNQTVLLDKHGKARILNQTENPTRAHPTEGHISNKKS